MSAIMAKRQLAASANSSTRSNEVEKMERNENGQFVKGHRGIGGRPRGSRNKLGEAFIARLYDHWIEHGSAVIAAAAKESPTAYLKVVASLLPKHLEIKDDPFDEFTDEQLASMIAYCRNALGLPEQDDSGAGAAAHYEWPSSVPPATVKLAQTA
jgi:hypothetical protein